MKHPVLLNNYDIALHRLNNLTKRLRRDPETLKKYDKIITEQLDKGIIEKVDITEPVSEGKVFYSSHRPVIQKDAVTTKVHVVYDASSEINGISLNDILLKGPLLTAELFSILLRFRTKNLALVADIEKAFLNIFVDETERDFLRFLWVKDKASRGRSYAKLCSSLAWCEGPDWFHLPHDYWPHMYRWKRVNFPCYTKIQLF